MIESVEPGKTAYLDNGAKVVVKELNPIKKYKRLSRVAKAEASHAVIAPENTDSIDGNITKVRFIIDIQAAAHHGDGDWHDRRATEATGGDFDGAIPVADRILEERHDQVVALASFLMDNNGRATRGQIFDLIERVETGPDLEISYIDPSGETHVATERQVKGEVIIVNFMDTRGITEAPQIAIDRAA